MNAQQRKVLLDRGFLVGAQIGRGTFGTVFQCTDIKTHVTYALKAMDLRTLRMRAEFQESRLLREVQVMRKLHHPFIVRLHDTVFTEDALFLIMELIIGVDLFDTIVAKGGFDELGAKFIFYQLCSALDYIHDQGILHRDIKPENILLRGPSTSFSSSVEMIGKVPSKTWIKLVDFGLSKLQTSGDVNSFVGTPRYIAPEVITVGEEEKRRRSGVKIVQMESSSSEESSSTPSPPSTNEVPQTTMIPSYSTPADCFSAGICLFVMMANCFPKFQDGVILFEGNNGRAAKFSPEAKDLILCLTNPDPDRRYTMKQALQHPWLVQAKPWVEDLIRSETSIVSISKNPSFSYSGGSGATGATTGSRSLKRPLVVAASPHHHSHQQPAAFPSQSFPTVVSAENWPQSPTINGDSSSALGVWMPSATTANASMPSSSSSQATASPPGSSPAPPSGVNLIPEIEREFWYAHEASPQICSTPEVRMAMRAVKNMLVCSERVVLKSTQTGMSVLDLIPDIRAALMIESNDDKHRWLHMDGSQQQAQQQAMFEYVKQMLAMVKQWIDQLKLETKDTLQLNHQVLLHMGQLVQQISLSPDVVADSVASLSFTGSPQQQQQQEARVSLACLSHLERVEQLLRIHESFWGKMDTALNVLQQRATILEGLTGIVLTNKMMAERFLQKLDEYFALWRSAAMMCQQFQQYNPNNNLAATPANVQVPGYMFPPPSSSSSPMMGFGLAQNAGGGGFAPPPASASSSFPFSSSAAGGGGFQQAPGSMFHQHHQPPASTVIVTNETSPSSSLESYEGDI